MKKNFFKKILCFCLMLSLFLCLTFKVNATKLEDYTPTKGTESLPLKTWENIQQPNDLLGVTLLFNDIIYPIGLSYDYDASSYLEISYSYNFEEYIVESKPIIWGTDSNGIQIKKEIERGMILRLQEEHSGDDPLSIFTETYDPNNANGLLYHLGDGDYEYNLTNIWWNSYWTYGPRLISFPLDQRDPEEVQLELIVNGFNYDTRYANAWDALYAFLERNTTIVYSSTMAGDLLTLDEIESYNQGYNVGYTAGYEDGYDVGVNDSGDSNYRFTFLTGVFNGVSDILSIELFPGVQLGYFVFIPLVLGIIGTIFFFWRKD